MVFSLLEDNVYLTNKVSNGAFMPLTKKDKSYTFSQN